MYNIWDFSESSIATFLSDNTVENPCELQNSLKGMVLLEIQATSLCVSSLGNQVQGCHHQA